MDALTTFPMSPASGLHIRAASTCPAEPTYPAYVDGDKSVIISEIKQDLVDAVFRCDPDGATGHNWGISRADADTTDGLEPAYCWLFVQIEGSCKDTKALKCIQDKGLKGNVKCLDKPDEKDPKKGSAGRIGVGKMVVVGVVVGLVGTSMMGMF